MNKKNLLQLLEKNKVGKEHAEKFASYCQRLEMEKDKKTGGLKNAWMKYQTDQKLADLFMRVHREGLVFDGEHITLQSTGISYDYIAYKNKMLLAYPESKIDVNLVYQGDEFSCVKQMGVVSYEHKIKEPFNQTEDNIIGGYCVIQNKRGDFFTSLSKAEIDKHRKVAKTDFIWRSWFKEMALKTVIKKACKFHFSDIYEEIEKEDNKNYDLENPIDLELEYKQKIDDIKTVKELSDFASKNKGKGKDFDAYIIKRKNQIENPQ